MKTFKCIGFLIFYTAVIYKLIVFTAAQPKARFSIYWMPYCPYGQAAMQKALTVIEKEQNFNFQTIHYLAHDHSASVTNAPTTIGVQSVVGDGCEGMRPSGDPDFGKFSSLHGRNETEESIRQVAILHLWPTRFAAYLKLFLHDPTNSWKERAERVGIPPFELGKVVNSPIGADWFVENISVGSQRGITLSPTLEIDGKTVQFPKTTRELRRVLCSVGTNACDISPAKVPPQDTVPAFLIVPKNLISAQVLPVEDSIKDWIVHLDLAKLDLEDAKAQEILQGIRIDSFPILVISKVLLEKKWSAQCIKELNLHAGQNSFYVTFDYSVVPFDRRNQIMQDHNGIHVVIDQYLDALLLHKVGKINSAARAYRSALLNDPKDWRAWSNLGAIMYDDNGLKQLGTAMFEQAVSLNSSYEPGLTNLLKSSEDRHETKTTNYCRDELGWLAIRNEHWADARSLLAELVTDKAFEFDARKGLAVVAVHESHLAEALYQLEHCLAISEEPGEDFANLLAGVYFRLGKVEEAAKWYEKAVSSAEASEKVWANYCYLLAASKSWEKLLLISDKSISKYPKQNTFGFYRAQALKNLDRSQDAIQLLEEIGRTDSSAQFRSNYEMAVILALQGDKGQAMKFAKRFIDLTRLQSHPMVCDECIQIGQMAFECDDLLMAVDAFQQALRINPSLVVIHDLLATCYEKMGRNDLCEEQRTLFRQFGGTVK